MPRDAVPALPVSVLGFTQLHEEARRDKAASKVAIPQAGEVIPGLASFLDFQTWAKRELPEPVCHLGYVVTNGSRLFLYGGTGLGKTMLGLAISAGMATGTGFLHWLTTKPCRVLYIDGEMASQLVKDRALSELRRCNIAPDPGMLVIYARDFDEQTDKKFPKLGKMPPLNTDEGHVFVHRLIDAIGGVDVIVFDHVMSLLVGNLKDEEPWVDTMPLVLALSAMNIGQIWFDHTGHNKTQQYGDSKKAWQFDAVGVMTALPEDQRRDGELAFKLSFDPPGKARRRTPDNRADFEPTTIRLADDRWAGEHEKAAKPVKARVSPKARDLHRALLDALVTTTTPGKTTPDAWHAEGARLGLLDAIDGADSRTMRERKRAKLRNIIGELKTAGWIGVDGETVRNLHPGTEK